MGRRLVALARRLEDRRCLVTGAAGGQGEAVARRFQAEGARIAVSDLAGERLDALAADLGAIAVAGDVRDEEQVAAVVQDAVENLGGLDVLYNNAGVLLAD